LVAAPVPAAPGGRSGPSRLKRPRALLPHPRRRLRGRGRAGAPSEVRDAPGPPAAVRLEGWCAHDQQGRGGLSVQRVLGHARVLAPPFLRL